MAALDVITLEQAKNWLEVDFPDKDEDIERLIKTAIAWVEKYTCHLLYQREISIPVVSNRTAIAFYPLADTAMKDKDGNTIPTMVSYGTLKTYVCCGYTRSSGTNVITANAGYTSVDDIPEPLIDAAYKLITYLFENHSAYSSSMPVDIQLLINQFRRSATV